MKYLSNQSEDDMNSLKTKKLIIYSLFGVVKESKELYKQILSVTNLKKAVLSQTKNSEKELHKFIQNHIVRSSTHS